MPDDPPKGEIGRPLYNQHRQAQRILGHDGEFFDVTMTGTVTPPPTPTLTGVVLTDAEATLSIPENDPNAAALFISDGIWLRISPVSMGVGAISQILRDSGAQSGVNVIHFAT
jgi:hypothetical protein